ncbi:hypothetical protein TNCV_740031 [Trichonephila clavipes]|nr:hypothetical protein TNCV_740031 [Trichonephila clavipes]
MSKKFKNLKQFESCFLILSCIKVSKLELNTSNDGVHGDDDVRDDVHDGDRGDVHDGDRDDGRDDGHDGDRGGDHDVHGGHGDDHDGHDDGDHDVHDGDVLLLRMVFQQHIHKSQGVRLQQIQ